MTINDLVFIFNQIGNYRASDIDRNSSTVTYYGYVDGKGNWYIMKQTINGTETNFTFVKGDASYSSGAGYPQAWSDRAGAGVGTYLRFHLVFK